MNVDRSRETKRRVVDAFSRYVVSLNRSMSLPEHRLAAVIGPRLGHLAPADDGDLLSFNGTHTYPSELIIFRPSGAATLRCAASWIEHRFVSPAERASRQ